jgi:RNA ligase (TIGR02306 family)
VRVFDVKDPEGNYWPQNKIFEELKEGQHVPLLYKGPYSKDIVLSLTNGKETISGKSLHIREGVVIKPEVDRIHPNAGRLALKSVSDDYYEWSRKNEGE